MDARLNPERSLDAAWTEVEDKITGGTIDNPDLFLLPEACLTGLAADSLTDEQWYIVPGDLNWQKFSKLARKFNAYIAASVLTLRDGNRYNSVVLFSRKGRQVFIYDKTYLTKPELAAGLTPGANNPDCFTADFGNIAFAICFDLNFRELFENYHRKGMEVLLFPSYFPGGRILSNLAFDFSTFAVSSHAQGNESVFVDDYGRELSRANMFTPALTQILELDSGVFPISGNLEKVDKIKSQYADAVEIEIHRPEAKMVIRVVGNGLTIDKLKKEYALI